LAGFSTKTFEGITAGIKSLFAREVKVSSGEQVEQSALLTLYVGLTGCWVVRGDEKDEDQKGVKLGDAFVKEIVSGRASAKRPTGLSIEDKPLVSAKHDMTALSTSEIIKRLSPQNKPVRVRLIVHDQMIFHKLVKFPEPPAGRDSLKGLFPFLPPPLAVDFRPLEHAGEAGGYYNVVALTMNLLRKFVNEAGEKALVLESIVPLSAAGIIAMRDAMVKDDDALIFPGPRCTTLVLGGLGGPYLVRTFTPGWKQVADAMEKAGIPAEEAVKALLTRVELGGRSVHRKEVEAFKIRVEEVVQETIGYYRDQLGKTPPKRFLACGHEIPPGLFGYEQFDKDPVALIAGHRLEDLPNLLEGTDEPLFKKGRVTYRFEPAARSFMEVSDEPARARASAVKAAKSAKVSVSAAARRKKDRLKKDQDRQQGDESPGLSLAGLTLPGVTMEDITEWREVIMVGALILIFTGFALSAYLDLRRDYKVSWDALVGLQRDAGSLAGDIAKLRAIKKPLWTQKLLVLSEELSTSLWITDVYVEDVKVKRSGQDIAGRELTIEGAALPAKAGHVKEIANYMDRLKKNKPFMEGVSKLYFGNVALDDKEEDVVRFKLKVLYEKAVVVTSNMGAETDKKGVMEDLTGKVKQHAEEQEKTIKSTK
jgi:hypothetical protein